MNLESYLPSSIFSGIARVFSHLPNTLFIKETEFSMSVPSFYIDPSVLGSDRGGGGKTFELWDYNQWCPNPSGEPVSVTFDNVPAPKSRNPQVRDELRCWVETFCGSHSNLQHIMTNSRVFEKINNCCHGYELGLIAKNLSSDIELFFTVSTHEYGSYAVRQVINSLRSSVQVVPIINVVIILFSRLVMIPSGADVIEDCFSEARNIIHYTSAPCRYQLINLIADNMVILAQNLYGTPVVQEILSIEDPMICTEICHRLEGNYVKLALHRNSSFVVDKCIRSVGMDIVVMDIIGSDQLLQMVKNGYGYNVIEKALDATRQRNPALYEELRQKLEIHRSTESSTISRLLDLNGGPQE